jgi:RNA polymerase sigma-54 factor
MKNSLQLKLSQHLTLTPQLQQSIRLLQLSTLDLNQELERFLAENPLLERDDGPPAYTAGESAPAPAEVPSASVDAKPTESQDGNDSWSLEDGQGPGWRDDGDDEQSVQQPAVPPSLQDHLFSQLNLTHVSQRDKQLITVLIANLDEDGYLTQPLEEILALLPAELEVESEELGAALKLLQTFDPTGIGARNLAECLTLQLAALPGDTPFLAQAKTIVQQHLDLLAARDFVKLKRVMGVSDDELRGAKKLITSLNPRPGSDFEPIDTRYVVPDIFVRRVRSRWVATLNRDAMPRLRINQMYADILQRNRDSSNQQLSSQLQEARWLIKNVQQRFETILKVSQAIVERQKHFFDHGDVAMRPLVLREIAETVGLHESTVSRVTTQKFMLTPRGIFELKYFFGSHVATDTGGAASSTAIRALIKQLVGAEDSKKPLSDSKIADILGQQGIVVARRTVAKYRESMQIQPANLRKSI